MSTKDLMKKEVKDLIVEAANLIDILLDKQKEVTTSLHEAYQIWYSRALKAVNFLAPDRYKEFKSYYEIDPKRKSLGYGTYVIQDYLKGIAPSKYKYQDFDVKHQTAINVVNQLTILQSLEKRIDSVLNDAEGTLYAELKDLEIATARKLLKINIRAAGALAGVILEGYLQKVAKNHEVTIKKNNPTISDLNEPLRSAGVYDMPTWRKISFLSDLRNLCSHKKSDEPSLDQVNELIEGVNWVSKNVA